MSAAKGEKEGTKDEKTDKSKTDGKTDGVITAVYKVNLHCRQCARDIKKPLLKTQGVHSVDVVFEKDEIKVKGVIDVIKIYRMIEKLSKKKVELISPQIKIPDKEKPAETQKKVKETKEQILRTTTVKVHLHCDKCEEDLRKKLLKHKDIFSVKSDTKAQTLTIQGTIESDKLLSYIRKKVNKHAEIISSKTEKKEEEKKENPKDEPKKKDDEKKENPKDEPKKDDEKKKENPKDEPKKKDDEKKENPKAEPKKDAGTKSSEKNEVVEFKQIEKVEVKSKEGDTPYFIHYVYAPMLFSDENPNACSII